MTTTTRQRWTALLAYGGCGVAVAWFVLVFDPQVVRPSVVMLALCVAVTNRLSIRWQGSLWVSGSFTFSMLAAVVAGPAAAFVVALVGELVAWALERYRLTAVAINVAGTGLPNLLAATLFGLLVSNPDNAAEVGLAVAVAGTVALAVNFLIVGSLAALETRDGRLLRAPRHLIPCLAWNVGVTAVVAVVIQRNPELLGAVLALVAAAGFVYMLRQLTRERRAAQAQAMSSLGLVEGLVGVLADRDPGAARHAAAVACFCHDIAQRSGMREQECGWAHLAGLLHDIGMMGLSDEVAAGSASPDLADWATIRRHPARGAEMARHLGPVAAAVRSHHERVDGRGYPDRLAGDEIPELARIVAVAEVYDTLTASHGYRRRVSSFEALRELQRVSGTQLDANYVEVLSDLLRGRSTEYRHGAGANVDSELHLERQRMLSAPM